MTSLIALSLAFAQAVPESVEYQIAGDKRSAVIYAPSKKSDNPPVIFGFHGHGGSSRNASRSFRMHEVMPEAVVVYMQGLPTRTPNDPEGRRAGWQVAAKLNGDRDLAFFDAVYSDVLKRFNADKRSIFAMGHSNGGRFTYLLWAERGDKFAAFAPSGSPARGLNLKPAPVLHILGEKDPIVSPDNQKATIESLKKLNGVSSEGKSLAEYATRYSGKDGNDLVTYIHPGGHEYPRPAPQLIADFFRSVIAARK